MVSYCFWTEGRLSYNLGQPRIVNIDNFFLYNFQYMFTLTYCMRSIYRGKKLLKGTLWKCYQKRTSTDFLIIFWFHYSKSIFTLFAPYAGSGILVAEISGSARYLISIGITEEGDYTVDFWLWTLGNEKPDGKLKCIGINGCWKMYIILFKIPLKWKELVEHQ